jgi:hypothetical protein
MQTITISFQGELRERNIKEFLKTLAKWSNEEGGIDISIYDRQTMLNFGQHYDIVDGNPEPDESTYWSKHVYAEVCNGDSLLSNKMQDRESPFSSLDEAFGSF